jgi:succinate-acetate transporter protein
MNLVILTYSIYLAISCAFTFWVGYTLFKNGKIFLMDAFHQDEKKANSVNHLLLTGFYLVNFGIVSLFMSFGKHPQTSAEVFEFLATKLGVVLVVLGVMHFYNMRNISNMSSRALRKIENSPVK